MKTEMIVKAFEDSDVFFMENGYINATQAARIFNKRASNWLRTDETKAYILALAHKESIAKNKLVVVKSGGDNNGTRLHYRLCDAFMRWLGIETSIKDFIINEVFDCKAANTYLNKLIRNYQHELLVNSNKNVQLYVVLFDTGMIKVGKGENAVKRVMHHARRASIFDRRILEYFIEKDPKITEEELIKFCLQHGTLFHGNEYFKDLKYEEVVKFVKRKVEHKMFLVSDNEELKQGMQPAESVAA